MDLLDSINIMKGVGPKKTEAFNRLGIKTVEDLIYYFPRMYEDRRNVIKISQLQENVSALFTANVEHIISGPYRKKRGSVLRLIVSDNTGSVEVVFFNGAYLSNVIHTGDTFTFHGTPKEINGRLQLLHPDFENPKNAQTGILSVYPLTRGISQREMRRLQNSARHLYIKATDILNHDITESRNLCSLKYALDNIHFPKDKNRLLESKYRLIFEEFLVLQLGMKYFKRGKPENHGIAFAKSNIEREYIEMLSYSLTNAQIRCVREIMKDMESSKQMNRLIQGDVGSGKTVVAEISMFKAVKSGYQAVLMVPTEILAHQHYEDLKVIFSKFGIRIGFLSGSMKCSEKNHVLEQLAKGNLDIIIGTHALIQPDVKFNNLGLVITDEQHRFGVNQRVLLKEKGNNPNIMVMTATPIPRTLAVVLYGDMDVSVIDEMPPGRLPVITKCFKSEKSRKNCYDFVKRQVKQGRQAYIVTSLIDQSEAMDARSVHEVYNELSLQFERCAVIHGAMKQSEKDRIMTRFAAGEIDVLVATVVIEVGINVPNATVIVVENSERFGLAQLHQLRGRVGRGCHQSYCFLIMEGKSELAMKRGSIMEDSNDGFFIAEEDLKLRGPGEIFGTRQHGLPEMKLADMARHMDVFAEAGVEADRILEEDPDIEMEKHRALRERINKLFGKNITLNL